MSNFKEIVAKTVVGKGKKTFTSNYIVEAEQTPNTVLGCWIINHRFSGKNNKNEVDVNGSFDVNVWYSYDNDSKTSVTTKNISYNEVMKLRVKDYNSLSNENEIIVRSLSQPTVQNVKINKDGRIELSIEKELGVEIVGEGKVKIAIEEDELPWDDIEDETIDQVTDEYLKNDTSN